MQRSFSKDLSHSVIQHLTYSANFIFQFVSYFGIEYVQYFCNFNLDLYYFFILSHIFLEKSV